MKGVAEANAKKAETQPPKKQKILSTSATTVLDQRPVMHIHRIHPIKLYCILLV